MRIFGLTIDSLFALFVLGFICAISWIFVLKPSARAKFSVLTWRFLQHKEQAQMNEALALALYLIAALTSSTILIAILVVTLVRMNVR